MAARAELRAAGRPKSDTNPKPTSTQHTGDGLQKTREASRRKLAETDKRDARD